MNQQKTIEPNGRICRGCGVFKSWENFDKKSDGFNGHHSQCKCCIKKFKRKWWKKKNMKKPVRPTVLEFAKSDIGENVVPFSQTEQMEFEKLMRSMVFDIFCSARKEKA